MALNLVYEVNDLFKKELFNKAINYLGESETGFAKAIAGTVPVVLQQLVNKTFTHEGAGIVAQMAGEQQHSGILDNWEDIFEDGSFLQKGTPLLSSLFNNRLDAVTGLLSNFSGLTPSSVIALLSIVVPAVLGIAGKHSTGGASGIAALLNGQKDNIAAVMPAGLNSSSIPGEWNAEMHVSAAIPTIIVDDTTETAAISDKSLLLLLPLLLLLLAAIAIYYLS